jgi:hypothetical protein
MPELPSRDQPIEVQETRQVHRLTMRRWFQGMLEAFEIDRGAVYTLRRLFVNPGAMFLDYLGSRRYHYVPSFRMLVLSTALILLIFNYLGSFDEFFGGVKEGADSLDSESIDQFQRIFINYFNLLLWLYLPFGALFTKLFNRKLDFTFAEHLVLQAYLLSIANILAIVFMLSGVIHYTVLFILYLLPVAIYYAYAYKVVFSKNWRRSVLESTAILFMSYLFYFLLVSILVALGLTLLNWENLMTGSG